MKPGRSTPPRTWRDRSQTTLGPHLAAQRVRVEALVADEQDAAQRFQQRRGGLDFVDLSGRNDRRHEPAPTLDQGADFGVESALGAPDGLGALPSGGIGRELVALDVGALR